MSLTLRGNEPADLQSRIRTLLRENANLSDRRWGDAAAAAAEAKHDEIARQIYRQHCPIGGCSMDTRPAEIARDYAETCYRMARLGCFLQLQVQIMGDQFNRVAYSSYGEASHRTEAERLAETGVDVDRFFLGLLVRFSSSLERQREIDPWRLARSIVEAGRLDHLDATLVRMATDPSLDEFNRLRATMVLSSARLHAERTRPLEEVPAKGRARAAAFGSLAGQPDAWKAILADVRQLDLPPTAQTWLDRQAVD